MTLAIVCLVLAVVLILLGMHVGVSFLTVSFLHQMISHGSVRSFARQVFSSHNSYSLLAVPLFSLGGLLMEKSGIADSLIDWCERLLRKVKGGIGAVIPLASMLFGMLTGSSLATVNTIGNVMIPKMERIGWDKTYTAALVAASGPLGYMIPPNMNAIIFSLVSPASVADLFLAGVIPGIIWGVGYILMNRLIYHKWIGGPAAAEVKTHRSASAPDNAVKAEKSFGRMTVEAIPAFFMPVIIIGGIYGGIFSPTEAGAVSALYACVIGWLVYRRLKAKDVFDTFISTGRTLGTILVVMPFAAVFSTILIMQGFPDAVMKITLGITTNKFLILLVFDVLFLIAGCFFDASVLTLVIPPLLMPTMNSLGVDPVQFGCIVFMALGIGSITPPLAGGLYLSAKIADVEVRDIMKPMMPFLLGVSLPVMLLVTYVPAVSLWLPHLING